MRPGLGIDRGAERFAVEIDQLDMGMLERLGLLEQRELRAEVCDIEARQRERRDVVCDLVRLAERRSVCPATD